MSKSHYHSPRFSSTPTQFTTRRRWSWASFVGGLILSSLLAIGVSSLLNNSASTAAATTDKIPTIQQTLPIQPTDLPSPTPKPVTLAAPITAAAAAAPTQPPRVMVLDLRQLENIDPASGISLDQDTQSLLKDVNDTSAELGEQRPDAGLADAPDNIKQAAAADKDKPVRCETPGVWYLPVRTSNMRITAIFGNYDKESPYFKSLQQVGGLTENAQGVFHPGIDLGTGMNAPAYAVADATVEKTDYSDQYGKHVILNVGNRQVLYGHLSDVFVVSGQALKCGQVIGITGDTGKSTTGPHLHFEVRVKGAPINPAKLLQISRNAILPSWERSTIAK